jgi:hypothetical protein
MAALLLSVSGERHRCGTLALIRFAAASVTAVRRLVAMGVMTRHAVGRHFASLEARTEILLSAGKLLVSHTAGPADGIRNSAV